jgi:hypothetical protein
MFNLNLKLVSQMRKFGWPGALPFLGFVTGRESPELSVQRN